MPSNRNAKNGQFKYPNRSMSPGEDKPDVLHLDLTETHKPVVNNFQRGPLPEKGGQERQSPMNSPERQSSQNLQV
jgi:hypothetical protein